MSNKFASGAKAWGICDVCGFRFPLPKLRALVVKLRTTRTLACPQCWVPDQPQLQLGMYPVADPQALRDPRPDSSIVSSRDYQWGWAPVGGAQSVAAALTPNSLLGRGVVATVTTS